MERPEEALAACSRGWTLGPTPTSGRHTTRTPLTLASPASAQEPRPCRRRAQRTHPNGLGPEASPGNLS